MISSRRRKSSRRSPPRCALRKNWKVGPPSTREKSYIPSTGLDSVMVRVWLATEPLLDVYITYFQ
jgi:hypothetical protein